MNISSTIEVTLPNGRVLNLKNSLTYAGVDRVTETMSGRGKGVNFTHFYMRHATSKSDAEDPETNFYSTRDLRAVTYDDFNTLNGSTGNAILELTQGNEIYSTDDSKYTNNIIEFPISFNATDMGNKFKDTNQANYSMVYYMGLASRPLTVPTGGSESSLIAGEYDKILSVIRLEENNFFGIPSTGTVGVNYQLNLAV
jgi:hypothetical protein